MNKRCARCEKTVYPIEELKCLDKVWHKLCFKCQICNMTLNMRNYKGFDKQPYCEAHIPKAKATTMAETPELRRIAENTKIQSNAVYHAEFERAKGKFTQVADDPETLRIKQNTKIISNAAYHGDLEKKAIMEQKRFLDGEGGSDAEDLPPTGGVNHHHMPPPPLPQGPPPLEQPTNRVTQYGRPPGRIADYDPMADKPRNSPYSARQSSTVIYTSDRGPVANPPTRRVGSIADLDPVNDFYGSLTADYKAPHHHPVAPHHPINPLNHHNNHNHVVAAPPPSSTNHQQQQQQQQHKQPITGRVYRAMYDYDAQDSDEVSFHDGDVIVNCTPIDEGWMTGMIQRTGQSGMLPANYVEPAN